MTQSLRYLLRPNMRTMMILVAVVGVALGWLVVSSHAQRDAVAAIRGAGGRVSYNGELGISKMRGQWKGGVWPTLRSRYRALVWLADRVGIDYFDHPAQVVLPAHVRLPEIMVHVGRLRRLDWLFIDGCDEDVSLAPLAGLAELKILLVRNAKIGDAGLAPLGNLKALRSLQLHHVGLTDAGLEHLAGLVNLEHLGLDGDQLTGAGFPRLSRLARLKQLDFGDSLNDLSGAALPDFHRRRPAVRISVRNGVYGESE